MYQASFSFCHPSWENAFSKMFTRKCTTSQKIFIVYFAEGFLTSCTFDYLTDSFDNHLFVGTLFTFSYCIPMLLIIYFYSQIVSHVFRHEKELRAQAKKMNVESLRSNTGTSTAEVRIAKAAITICFLFVAGKC